VTAPTVRAATAADIPAMSVVLTASIRELCQADHQNRSEVLSGWLRNKSEAGVRDMLESEPTTLYVAEIEGQVAGVGATMNDGSIRLNYVSPDFRFRGVSRALMAHMEEALRTAGFEFATLNSSTTAHRFYQEAGWVDVGEPQTGLTLVAYPMRKVL